MQSLQRIAGIILLMMIALAGEVFAGEPPFLKNINDNWVKSSFSAMTEDERIGQLIMVTAYPEQGEVHISQLKKIIEEYHPGGILVMKGSPLETAELINELQLVSKTPLLVAIDGETGLGFRLSNTINYPPAQALGAIQDDTLIYKMGCDIGKQLKEIGIHINFAPVADINTNPSNPIINFRSFGENKTLVAEKSWMMAKGMQDEGVAAVAKHYPGHGNTQSDSHKSLPVLGQSFEELQANDIYPFRFLSQQGIAGIMSGHLYVPAFDKKTVPASLSEQAIKHFLRDSLGFKGFVVTDAMNMKGVNQPAGRAEVEALQAGNDMVEFVADMGTSVTAIKKAILSGELDSLEIYDKCRRILALKKWAGLDNYKPAILQGLEERLNLPVYELGLRRLTEGSLTVLQNRNILPVDGLDTLSVASVDIGGADSSAFSDMLSNYTQIEHFYLPKDATSQQVQKLMSDLKRYSMVICGVHGIGNYPYRKFGVSDIQVEAVKLIARMPRSVIVFFGNVYAMRNFEDISQAAGLVVAFQDSRLAQELSAQLVFGAIGADGKLPVTVSETFRLGDGMPVKKNGRLSYTISEEVGINSFLLTRKIDSIAWHGIDSSAFPGCQVLVAKDGKVIFHKCYGFQTYEKKVPVAPGNLYDFASVTKIAGPLPALMKLAGEGKFDVDAPIVRYWPDFAGSNKERIKVRDILAHQGQLKPWIPYYQSTLRKNPKLRSKYFKSRPSAKYSIRVAENLYMKPEIRDSMFAEIKSSPLLPRKKMEYSDMAFYLFPDIISRLTNSGYEEYLQANFYRPLGAYSFTYNPYRDVPPVDIIPTEFDDIFRHGQLRGFVHDEGAAMLGGVSGHAGLFGTANDLAKLMQMYLQKGFYAGRQYIPSKIMDEFTRCQFSANGNRRGLGFDKPSIGNNKLNYRDAYPAPGAGPHSFGHSGYTGTFTWADPDNNLLFVFLSNRVFPTRENQKINTLRIRKAMYQAICDCIKKGL